MFQVKFIDGVLTYKDLHVWEHSSESLVGTLVVQITPTASEQRILSKVSLPFPLYIFAANYFKLGQVQLFSP